MLNHKVEYNYFQLFQSYGIGNVHYTVICVSQIIFIGLGSNVGGPRPTKRKEETFLEEQNNNNMNERATKREDNPITIRIFYS